MTSPRVVPRLCARVHGRHWPRLRVVELERACRAGVQENEDH